MRPRSPARSRRGRMERPRSAAEKRRAFRPACRSPRTSIRCARRQRSSRGASAPPPPLIRRSAGSISSAPSTARSSAGSSSSVVRGMPSARQAGRALRGRDADVSPPRTFSAEKPHKVSAVGRCRGRASCRRDDSPTAPAARLRRLVIASAVTRIEPAHQHVLHLDELLDAVVRAFAAEPGFLDAAERRQSRSR